MHGPEIAACGGEHGSRYTPLLRESLAFADDGDEPRMVRLDRVEGWWRAYEAACRAFRPEGP